VNQTSYQTTLHNNNIGYLRISKNVSANIQVVLEDLSIIWYFVDKHLENFLHNLKKLLVLQAGSQVRDNFKMNP
jgi:hypothetical protein